MHKHEPAVRDDELDIVLEEIPVEEFPNKDKVEFKPKFVERYQKLTDFEEFKKYSLAYPRRSIRVNTLKSSVADIKRRLAPDWELTPIPWCDVGFWIKNVKDGRRDIGNLKEHSLGYIYVQDASSMIPPIVLAPQPGDSVLDMCAAPGSKTTQMAAMMENEGIIFANDYQGIRLAPLGINVQRVGATNIVSTLMYGQWYVKSGIMFDKVLLDAPCSGTGTINKSLKTLRMWNPDMVKRLAATQRKLIETAYKVLNVGGVMTYSTCSNEPEEDEGVISWFLTNFPDAKLMDIELDIKRSNPIMQFDGHVYNPEVRKCLRIWPQDNHTEGFFVAKIKKAG
jgi:tRNA (cytosine49-C5)-methyltransferase